MNIVDEFVVMLGLDGSGAKKGITDVKNSLNNGIAEMTSKLKGFAAQFAAAFAVQQTFSAYTAEADALGKLADAMNMNIESLHAWSEASARSGGSADAFRQSLQALNTQLVRTGITGQSRAKGILEGVGIDAGEIGRTRDALSVMQDLAEKAETMSKTEFLGLGQSLGLDTGTIMLLAQGRDGLKEAIQAQKELGVYTKEDARVTAEWNDRIDDSAQAFKAFSAVIFREILPVFTMIVKGFNDVVSTLRRHETFVKAFFLGLAVIITGMLIPAFTALAAAIYANPLTWIVLGLAALAAVIEDLVVWAQGGEAAFGSLWAAILGSPEEAMQAFDDISKAFNTFLARVRQTADNLKMLFHEAFEFIKRMWNAVVGGLRLPSFLMADTVITGVTASNGGGGGSLGGNITNNAYDSVTNNAYNSVTNNAFDNITNNAYDSVTPSDALPMGGARSNVNNIDSDTNIGNINVYTQATDAEGISRDIGGAVSNNVGGYYATQANVGVID